MRQVRWAVLVLAALAAPTPVAGGQKVLKRVDLRALETVVNLDAPASAADYVHRVGRVGRNGRAGRALTLYTSDDAAGLRAVANIAKQTGCADVPPWLLAKTTKKAWANADPRAKRKRDAPG